MNVKIIKLVSTEELLAEVKDGGTDMEIIVENPMRLAIIPHPEKEGEGTLAMMPWIPYTSAKTISIKKVHIIYMVDADTDMSNDYSSKFGSGIVIPNINSTIQT